MSKNLYNEESVLSDFEENDDVDKDKAIYKKQFIVNKYYFHLDEEILEPFNYRAMCLILKEAFEGDEIHFIINTVGGNVDSFIQIFNAMLQSKAFITGEILTAYSCGSLIALACDQIIVGRFSSLMCHSLSWNALGKSDEIKMQADFLKQWNEQIITRLYTGFLTTQEIDKILEGKDFWFGEDEILKRLEKWVPLRQRIFLEQNEEKNKIVKKKKK